MPSDSDTDLVDEFDYDIKRWAAQNHMVINLQKTKELVFRRPNPRLVVLPVPLDQIEQVHCAKLQEFSTVNLLYLVMSWVFI